MHKLESHLTKIKARIGGSLVFYLVFCAMAFVAALQGASLSDDRLALMIIPIVASILILPRSTKPSAWPTPETDEEADRLDLYRDTLRVFETRALYLRIAYVVIAAFLLFILPKMMGA